MRQVTTPKTSVGKSKIFSKADLDTVDAIRDVKDLRKGKRAAPRGADDSKNTCYRNAVLLTLLCNDGFMAYLINHWPYLRTEAISRLTDSKKKATLRRTITPFKRLSDLWQAYWDPKVDQEGFEAAMKQFWRTLTEQPSRQDASGWFSQDRSEGEQQDVREFLEWCLTHEKDHASDMPELFEDYMRLFALPFAKWEMCVSCSVGKDTPGLKRVSLLPDEHDLTWTLDVPQSSPRLPLITMMGQHIKSVRHEPWFCSDCSGSLPLGAKAASKWEMKYPSWKLIGRLPEIFFVVLNRAQRDKNDPEKDIKVSSEVEIEEGLDFNEYPNWFDQHNFAVSRSIKPVYEVTAVISHRGDTIDEGHYKTNVLVDDQWWDIQGNVCQKSSFKSAAGNDDGFDPVTMVYRRVEGDAAKALRGKIAFRRKAHAAATVDGGSPDRRRSRALSQPSPDISNATKPASAKGEKAEQPKANSSQGSPASPSITDPSKSQDFLRLEVTLGDRSHLIHHKIKPLGGSIISDAIPKKGAEVKIDAQLLREEIRSTPAEQALTTTTVLDLTAATKRQRTGYESRLSPSDYSWPQWTPHHQCPCGEVHEGACQSLKRKSPAIEEDSAEAGSPCKRRRVLPALFPRPGDDPYNYPSLEERCQIQDSINGALNKFKGRWDGWMPPKVKPRFSKRRPRMTTSPASDRSANVTKHQTLRDSMHGAPRFPEREDFKSAGEYKEHTLERASDVVKVKSILARASAAQRNSPAFGQSASPGQIAGSGPSHTLGAAFSSPGVVRPGRGPMSGPSSTGGRPGFIIPGQSLESGVNVSGDSVPPLQTSQSSSSWINMSQMVRQLNNGRPLGIGGYTGQPLRPSSSPRDDTGAVFEEGDNSFRDDNDELNGHTTQDSAGPSAANGAGDSRSLPNDGGDSGNSSSDDDGDRQPMDPHAPGSLHISARRSRRSGSPSPEARRQPPARYTKNGRRRTASTISTDTWKAKLLHAIHWKNNFKEDFIWKHRHDPVDPRYISRSYGWVNRQVRGHPKRLLVAGGLFLLYQIMKEAGVDHVYLSKAVRATLVSHLDKILELASEGPQKAGILFTQLRTKLMVLMKGGPKETFQWLWKTIIEVMKRTVHNGPQAISSAVRRVLSDALTGTPRKWDVAPVGAPGPLTITEIITQVPTSITPAPTQV